MISARQCRVGQTVTFEGYADDYGSHVVAVELTLDDGATWASFDTSGSDPDLSVHWTYSFTPRAAGTYRLRARAVTEDGRRSPVAADALLYVSE